MNNPPESYHPDHSLEVFVLTRFSTIEKKIKFLLRVLLEEIPLGYNRILVRLLLLFVYQPVCNQSRFANLCESLRSDDEFAMQLNQCILSAVFLY